MKNSLKNIYLKSLRKIYLNNNKKVTSNKDCSIISINCIGGVVSHEFNLRFNSPTVNLWFGTKDYLKFLNNMQHYLYDCDLVQDEILSNQYGYPVGILGDIKIFFQHYTTFDEAKYKWNERTKRVKWDNLYVIMVQGEDCTEQDIVEFDSLYFKHKVCFTAKEYPKYNCCYYISNSQKNDNSVRNLCDNRSKLTGKFWLDEFDWASFLNNI